MMTTNEPTGPFFSNYGPHDGPILFGEAPVMGVLDAAGEVVGIAWLAGSAPGANGPVQVWRLEVRKAAIEGRWVCTGRRFVRLGRRVSLSPRRSADSARRSRGGSSTRRPCKRWSR